MKTNRRLGHAAIALSALLTGCAGTAGDTGGQSEEGLLCSSTFQYKAYACEDNDISCATSNYCGSVGITNTGNEYAVPDELLGFGCTLGTDGSGDAMVWACPQGTPLPTTTGDSLNSWFWQYTSCGPTVGATKYCEVLIQKVFYYHSPICGSNCKPTPLYY